MHNSLINNYGEEYNMTIRGKHIFTLANSYYRKMFSRRSSLMDEYIENMKLFLSIKFPDKDISEIEKFIKSIIKNKYRSRNCKYLFTEKPGDVSIKEKDLLSVTNKLNDEIITPYGSTFVTTDKMKSFFIDHIESRQAERKIIKKDMLLAEANKDEVAAMIGNLKQMNIKIDINAISGIMLSNVFFSSAISYNSITASARHNIMLGYSYTEMALTGNLYLYNENQAINWIVNLLRIYPGDDKIKETISKYKLKIPSIDDVTEYIISNTKRYSKFARNKYLKDLISKLDKYKLTFVFYACNLNNIFTNNDQFKIFFSKCFDVDKLKLSEKPVESIFSLEDNALFILTVVILSNEMTGITLDKIDDYRPELAKKIHSLYHYLQSYLGKLDLLMNTFMLIPVLPSDVGEHKNMIRKTTILSDTDSIIFTNLNWVKWYTDDIKVNRKSYAMNAMMIFLISKILEHVFAYSSACMNISEKNIKDISIKNEFMFDVFIRTSMAKHYAGYIKFREGNVLNPYKFELKGKNFIGSDLCENTREFTENFIKWIMNTILTDYELSVYEILRKTIEFEESIKTSVLKGDTTYLIQSPISNKEDYKNPLSSSYFYYLLWQDVFSDKYIDINLPQKCKVLPIKPITINNISKLEYMKNIDKKVYKKFIDFTNKYPKKSISRVFIPMGIEIPDEVKEIADLNKVIYMNCAPVYLMLSSFGIVNSSYNNKIILFSDIYKDILEEVKNNE